MPKGSLADRLLLDRLRGTDGPVPGEGLARDLGVSRVALWKRISALKSWGYVIEADHRGYTLVRDDGLAPADLDPEASGTDRTCGDGSRVRVLAEAGSTMDEARAWASRGAPSGAAVLALRQSSGRGRNGRAWRSPDGGLYLSLVLRSPLPPACAGALVLEAARSLLGVLESEGIQGASFRWPNDIVAGPRKLGGLLLESCGGMDRTDHYILGVGLNRSPVSLEERPAVGLDELGARTARRRDIARTLARMLRSWCERPETDPRRWAELSPDPRRPVRADLWDGRELRGRPRGYTRRGELALSGPGIPLAPGECRKMTYEGEKP